MSRSGDPRRPPSRIRIPTVRPGRDRDPAYAPRRLLYTRGRRPSSHKPRRDSMRPTARLFALLLLLAALAAPPRASAQDTANPFADLGLPEIAITATDTAFDGAPSELEAGRYVLSVANSSSSGDDAGVGFVRAPEGMTAAEVIGVMAGLSATPEAADGGATPAEEEGGAGAPSWYHET